ncbi:MAG TPA: glycerophosphodiester phosphodiesterase [Thermoanaerobaculia bacterium]|jgi:glycerophosphoryl diester phosphodiesterase
MTRLGGGWLARAETALAGLWERPSPAPDGPRLPIVVAHRGASRLQPENTVAAFAAALDEGADAIETDVCMTSDRRYVLWHDADPDERVSIAHRWGLIPGLYVPEVPPVGSHLRRRVRDLSWPQLRANFRYRRSSSGEERQGAATRPHATIDTLEELLEWAVGEPEVGDVFLDLKLADDQVGAAVGLYVRVEQARLKEERLTFHLLTPQREIARALVERWRARPDPGLRVTPDFERPGASDLAPRIGAADASLGCRGRFWSAFRADVARAVYARSRGRLESVVAWTVNERDRLFEMLELGVDGILTDEPGLLRSLIPLSSPWEWDRVRAEAAAVPGSV